MFFKCYKRYCLQQVFSLDTYWKFLSFLKYCRCRYLCLTCKKIVNISVTQFKTVSIRFDIFQKNILIILNNSNNKNSVFCRKCILKQRFFFLIFLIRAESVGCLFFKFNKNAELISDMPFSSHGYWDIFKIHPLSYISRFFFYWNEFLGINQKSCGTFLFSCLKKLWIIPISVFFCVSIVMKEIAWVFVLFLYYVPCYVNVIIFWQNSN